MKTLVVIVNYKTPALVADCLRSLAPQVREDVHVVVTDNASPDDSVAQISKTIADEGYGRWCTFLPLERNGGFAYGNNEAIARYLSLPRCGATADSFEKSAAAPQRGMLPTDVDFEHVWLLNPDTIVLDHALSELEHFLDAHPRVGIAGGRAENRDGTVRRSCFRFHSPLGELESAVKFGPVSRALSSHIVAPPIPDAPEKVGWVSGASMMVRREVFEKVGLLDAGYFMYFEETDFCLRADRSGFECWYVPASRIIHLVGQASGVTGAQRVAKRRPKYWFDSRKRYFKNNFGSGTLHAANLFWLAGYPIGRLWQLVRWKPREDPPRLWWDFLRYNYFAR